MQACLACHWLERKLVWHSVAFQLADWLKYLKVLLITVCCSHEDKPAALRSASTTCSAASPLVSSAQ